MANILKGVDYSVSDPLINELLSINEDHNENINDDFPVHCFPVKIQEIINSAYNALKYPKCYLSGGILFASSVAIGNSYKAKVRNGWVEPAILYILNVGDPGVNKTHPTKFALDPLFKLDAETYKMYKARKKEFDELSSMPRKERQEMGRPDPVRPIWEKYLVSDSTPEALVKIHEFNPRSIGLYADEALAWISNFNRYSKGSESQFWLSNWSQTAVIIDRKGDDSILIQHPFISVIGSIQPSMLSELAKENRGNNGFLDRLLFVYPENISKEYWPDDELDPCVAQQWTNIVRRITTLDYPLDPLTSTRKSKEIPFSPEAFRLLKDWQRTNTDLCNQEHARVKSIYSKMEILVPRFSLVLHALKWACDEDQLGEIGPETVKGAVALTEYFRATALRVNSLLNEVNPMDLLAKSRKQFIESLPDEFETREALGIAAALIPPIPERTVHRILKDTTLFDRVKHGTYAKK